MNPNFQEVLSLSISYHKQSECLKNCENSGFMLSELVVGSGGQGNRSNSFRIEILGQEFTNCAH